MKWNKLKDYKCPKCFEDLTRNIFNKRFECLSCNEFSISEEKFTQIITQEYHPRKRIEYGSPPEEDNLSALNNLGHKKVKEGFI